MVTLANQVYAGILTIRVTFVRLLGHAVGPGHV